MKILPHCLWLMAVLTAFWFGRKSDESVSSTPQTVFKLDRVMGSSGKVEQSSKEDGLIYSKPDLAGLDIGRALHQAFRDSDPLRRRQQVALMLSGLTLDHVGAALDAFENAPPAEINGPEFQDFLFAWGRLDGAAAMTYARDENSPRRDLEFGGAAAIAGWASQDAEGATAFVDGLSGDFSRDYLHGGIVDGLLVSDVNAALDYVLEHELGGKKKWLIQLNQAIGADRILDWIDRIDEDASQSSFQYKDRMSGEVIEQLARFDQPRVAAWVEENAEKPFLTSWTIINARPMDRSNGKGLDWIQSLPVSDARGGALGQRLLEWSRHDANAAGEWLAARQEDPQYDRMVQSFAREVFSRDPEAAMAWAGTIRDAAERRSEEAKLLKRWQKNSPEE